MKTNKKTVGRFLVTLEFEKRIVTKFQYLERIWQTISFHTPHAPLLLSWWVSPTAAQVYLKFEIIILFWTCICYQAFDYHYDVTINYIFQSSYLKDTKGACSKCCLNANNSMFEKIKMCFEEKFIQFACVYEYNNKFIFSICSAFCLRVCELKPVHTFLLCMAYSQERT